VRSVLLDALDPVERNALIACLRPRHYERGQVVFNDGDVGDCLHLVQSGRLDVQVTTRSGQTMTLRIVHPGELVGEMALVHHGHRRTGRVCALEPVDTYVLFQRDFDALRREHPAVDRFLVGALAERVIHTSELVMDLLEPPDIRVWKRLAVLSDAYGAAPIRMSQEDLARASGTVRQTVNRVLRIGVREGMLDLGRGVIRVLDPAALDARARGLAG
jgi:CRP/FNR family transcriptional regulator, cyclic AMP receptor protein